MASTNKQVELVGGNCYQEDEGTRASWSDLPPELGTLVLSRLFMGDYVIASHTICKSWQSFYDKASPRLFYTSDPLLYKYPYIMFPDTSTRLVNFYHPIRNATYQLDIPDLYNVDIRLSKDNWLIMSLGEHDLFHFNPFTGTKIELPEVALECGFSRMCFSSNPTSLDFVVFGFSDGYDWMDVCTFKLGEEDWTIHDKYDSTSKFKLAGCSPVMCDGLVYFLGVMGRLGIFDPTSNNLSWIVRMKPRQRFKNSEQIYMVESEVEILSVLVGREERKVDVFKLDFKTNSWKDVESLGDKMLFLTLNSSFSGKAVVRKAENNVYFPRLHGNDGVFYSLKTKKFHSVTGLKKIDSDEPREIKKSAWVPLCS